MSDDQLERVRRACLALPEATEQEAWGAPTFRVRKKIFAMYAAAGNHHGEGQAGLWCPAPIGVQEMLVRAEPEKYFVPPYVGPKGWVGIALEHVSDRELQEHAVQGYCIIAPKKLQALLDG